MPSATYYFVSFSHKPTSNAGPPGGIAAPQPPPPHPKQARRVASLPDLPGGGVSRKGGHHRT
ncbi:hypothetical protein IMZ48_11900 [Candidatus Bathyarchaeota archaeon]|nr:hypothetical protein [Candidatus Bathyarchaeota archaeon]